jgi:hypothetical protein
MTFGLQRMPQMSVMAGLVPAIHVAATAALGGGVVGRDKPGHDDFYAAISVIGFGD